MKVVRFDKQKHFNMITEWYINRKQNMLPLEYLPETGFIVPNICAGFLYKTDSKLALIENYISCPKSDKETRSNALDLVTKSLIDEAKKYDFNVIMALTKLDSVRKRAEKSGFQTVDNDFSILVRRV